MIYDEIDIMIINKTNKINKLKNENIIYREKVGRKGMKEKNERKGVRVI